MPGGAGPGEYSPRFTRKSVYVRLFRLREHFIEREMELMKGVLDLACQGSVLPQSILRVEAE